MKNLVIVSFPAKEGMLENLKETLKAALASISLLEQKDKINSFFLPSKSTNWTVNR